MKAEKKPRAIKQKIREERKREERLGLVVIATILIAVIFISGFMINSLLNQPSTSQPVISTSEPKAAIVDQLSLTYPNQTFIQNTTDTLEQGGYSVDYYPGEEITVEFYRNLPTHGYRIIVLRVHSGLQPGDEPPLSIFTSEPYDKSRYLLGQLNEQLGEGSLNSSRRDEQTYFAITPEFVKKGMNGRFLNTTVVMMGCNGLAYNGMAEAFREKGAKVYISWSRGVTVSHTDHATTHLLQYLVIEKLSVLESAKKTFEEVGFDPVYGGLLVYYPLEAEDYTIESMAGKLIISTMVSTIMSSQKPRINARSELDRVEDSIQDIKPA